MSKNAWLWIRDIAITVVIVIVVFQFIGPTIVNGSSMENTLHDRDYLFLSKQAYSFGGEPQRGDIVVAHSSLELDEGNGTKNLIKRVIAIPGDTVSIYGGSVYVNGEALIEPYIKDGYTEGDMPEVTVPEGTVFLLGDNRQNSGDSREPEVGFVPKGDLIGKAIFRLFPFDKFGRVE
jgi:signal peptidase I